MADLRQWTPGDSAHIRLRVERVHGTIFQFVSKETGRPYTLTDMNGNRVFADYGTLVTTFQVDTKGDDVLWNKEFIEGSYSLVRETGSHPFYHFDGDFCDIVRDLLGDGTGAASGTGARYRADLAPLHMLIAGRPW